MLLQPFVEGQRDGNGNVAPRCMGPRRVRSFLFRRQANKRTSKVKAKAARQVKSKTNIMQRKRQHYCISVSAQASIPDSSVSAVLAEPRHDIMLPRFYDSCFRGRRPLERGERPRACADDMPIYAGTCFGARVPDSNATVATVAGMAMENK